MGALRHPAVIAVAVVVAGCPGRLDDRERFRGDYCRAAIERLLATTCGAGGCHDGNPDNGAGLDLTLSGATMLRGGPASSTSDCAGAGSIIDPVSPEQSLLYTKATANPPCGARMPIDGSELDDEQLSCLLDWIAVQEPPP